MEILNWIRFIVGVGLLIIGLCFFATEMIEGTKVVKAIFFCNYLFVKISFFIKNKPHFLYKLKT